MNIYIKKQIYLIHLSSKRKLIIFTTQKKTMLYIYTDVVLKSYCHKNDGFLSIHVLRT